MKNDLELLERIAPTAAPPFLLTRIQQKIKDASGNYLSLRCIKLAGLALVFLIGLNAIAFVKLRKEKKPTANLAQQLNLNPENSFYNE
jgi:hypothetical protein